ncbi:flavin monoamine oxidase family protein [Microvirga puerhi]|uniref:Tryptophan 2-monooxygenase n=1 Tax=Microvirga puerhi TaxID=2876078 RepID=A0ABS7VPV5_9HYPH|nr:NAD(P)/FAD-dependent oxidoreductase [Microvirga puerhi]MBZ6077100.1 FAD-dependent oxidoreductase [Microvirga puerhi]
MPSESTAEAHPLPDEVDVVVIGAGAAGIGSARRLRAAGLSTLVLEARDRIGGRAHTVSLQGHPIDLGAHWLHNGPINPLVHLGHARGEPLRQAPGERHLFIRGRPATRAQKASLGRAFALSDAAIGRAMHGPDRAAASVLPSMGPFGRRVIATEGLISGRPFDEVSLHDVPDMAYGENSFIRGGLGAYIGRLAEGLRIRLCAPVQAIDWAGPGVRIDTPAGALRARAVIVTVPMMVLQRGGVQFTPALPIPVQDAIHGFTQGVYEHVVLHWPDAPFRGPDRLASLLGYREEPAGLLTWIDGAPFHYVELDLPTASRFDGRDADAPGRYVRALLAEHFGHRAIDHLRICCHTTWRHDPWSLASWAVVPPGLVSIRDRLKESVGERIWFAGEALSRLQWGTVGGAWEEGNRAAKEIAARLG